MSMSNADRERVRQAQQRLLALLEQGQCHATALAETLETTELDTRMLIESLRARGELIIETDAGFKLCTDAAEFAAFMQETILPGLGRAVAVANVLIEAANVRFGMETPPLQLLQSKALKAVPHMFWPREAA